MAQRKKPIKKARPAATIGGVPKEESSAVKAGGRGPSSELQAPNATTDDEALVIDDEEVKTFVKEPDAEDKAEEVNASGDNST
jgi:hypothetical protein